MAAASTSLRDLPVSAAWGIEQLDQVVIDVDRKNCHRGTPSCCAVA